MSTATAPAILNKNDQATQLRAEAQTLGKEVSELQQKLEPVQRTLGLLQDKRRELAESGKPAGDLHLKIADAEAQADVLRSRLSQKQAALDTARVTLESLQSELNVEARSAARQTRFDLLKKQGTEAAARIAEKLRILVAEDLPALDTIRDQLAAEYINDGRLNDLQNNPEVRAARALIHQLTGQFWDRSVLAVERDLLNAGWQPRADLVFTIRNLRKPK